MSYIIMRGFQAWASESAQDVKDETSQAWFEGFATGLHEAKQLTGEEFDNCIDYCTNVFTGLSTPTSKSRLGLWTTRKG